MQKELILNGKRLFFCFTIALHNIPEGLAVGVAFGAIASPEPLNWNFHHWFCNCLSYWYWNSEFSRGFAVSLPLRRQGMIKFKSWQWGQPSAIVEPIFAVISNGCITSLPYFPMHWLLLLVQ